MAYISKFSGEEIDNLLTNSSSANDIIGELESDMANLSTSIENSLSSIDTEIENLKSTSESLITRMTNAETKLNTTFTASRALVSNSSGQIAASSVTSTQLGYLSGVTSAIQTQLNNKAPSYTYSTTDLTAGSSPLTTGKLYIVYE